MDWIRLHEDTTCTAFGPHASHLLLHYRKELDKLLSDLQRGDVLNARWQDAYGKDAIQYVRNTHFLFDSLGVVKAAGSLAHCTRYRQFGDVIVIRASKAPCTCENNGDYCTYCLSLYPN